MMCEQTIHLEEAMAMKERLAKIDKDIQRFCDENQCSSNEIKSRRRDQRLVELRAVLYKSLVSKGYIQNDIAKAVNRDHSSIYHLLSDDRREKNKARSRAYWEAR